MLWAQPGTQEFPSEHQQTLLHIEGVRALAQDAQRGCGGSLLGNSQKVPRHIPGLSAVGSPASPGRLGKRTSRSPSTIL